MSLTKPASPDLGQIFPATSPCAKISDATGQPCGKIGVKTCSGCFLVSYCSKECQMRHWKQHKAECMSKLSKATWRPSWEAEQRKPRFVLNDITSVKDKIGTYGKKKYLWGNMPALDVLRLKDNEGVNYDQDINLLFAASGDLRNVVKTIVGIPSTSSQSFTAVLNDRDFDIVARNAILLLTALYIEPAPVASASMLHTWYSAVIPSSILQMLRATVLPLIQNVCKKIANKPEDRVLSKTFTQGSCSLRLVLQKRCWVALLGYLEVPDGLTVEEAGRVRKATMLAPERKDYLERTLFCQPLGWRNATMQFRNDGVLMPFGSAREPFDTPNPTFFQERDVWPMKDSADPIGGWSMDDVLKSTPQAKNDLYGGLFFHLRDMLIQFCNRLKKLKVKFVLLHTDAVELPDMLERDFHLAQSFDRIEISNIADGGYLGLPICLHFFAPFLRFPSDNPHAMLITLFMNAIGEIGTTKDTTGTMMREMGRVVSLLPTLLQAGAPNNEFSKITESSRRMAAYDLLGDFDGLWARYMRAQRFDEVARDARVRAKTKQTIVAPWPERLRKNATKAEFEILLGSNHVGYERYVEWQRLPE